MCPNPPYVYTSEDYLKLRWDIQQPEKNSRQDRRVLILKEPQSTQSGRPAWHSLYPLNRKI